MPFTLPSLHPGYSLFFPSSCPILWHPFLRASPCPLFVSSYLASSLPLFRSACSFFICLPAYRPRSSSSFFSMLVLAPSLLSIFLRQPFPLYPTPSKWLLLTSGFYTPEPEVEHVGKFLERERERERGGRKWGSIALVDRRDTRTILFRYRIPASTFYRLSFRNVEDFMSQCGLTAKFSKIASSCSSLSFFFVDLFLFPLA